MKLALVNGERQEPAKGLLGNCTGCGQPMVPKCGPIKIWHWAHKTKCECDRWWENETEWHRAWKNHFPIEYQEIKHKDESSGEWHIADVKTKHGQILEFQHSFLKDEERQSRNKFYAGKLVWVVDGLKRIKDKSNFDLFLKHAMPIRQNSPILKLHPFLDECSLIEEWSKCSAPVFFDFGTELTLWCLLPKSSEGNYYILEYSRQNFIALHTESLNGSTFSDFAKVLFENIFEYEYPELIEAARKKQMQTNQQPPVQRSVVVYPTISLNDLLWLRQQITRIPQPRYITNKRVKRRL